MAARLRGALRPAGGVRQAALLGGGAALGQGVAVLASPLLTRLYDVGAFGTFGSFSALSSCLACVATLRLDQAILLERDEAGAADVLRLCVLAVAAVTLASALAALGIWLWASAAGPGLGASGFGMAGGAGSGGLGSGGPGRGGVVLALLPVAVASGGIVPALSLWFVRRERYRPVAVYQASRSGFAVLLQGLVGASGAGFGGAGSGGAAMGGAAAGGGVGGIGHGVGVGGVGVGGVGAGSFGAGGFGVAALVGGQVVGQLLAAVWLAGSGGRALRLAVLRGWEAGRLRAALRRHRGFALYGAPQVLLRLLGTSLPALVLPVLYGPAQAGLFWLAYRMLILPQQVLTEALRPVFFRRAAALHAGGGDVRAAAWRMAGLLGALCLPVAVVLMLAGPALFGLVFGAAWRGAGHDAALISLAWCLETMQMPSAVLVAVLGRQRAYLGIEAASLVARAAALGVGGLCGGPDLAVGLYAAVWGATNAGVIGWMACAGRDGDAGRRGTSRDAGQRGPSREADQHGPGREADQRGPGRDVDSAAVAAMGNGAAGATTRNGAAGATTRNNAAQTAKGEVGA